MFSAIGDPFPVSPSAYSSPAARLRALERRFGGHPLWHTSAALVSMHYDEVAKLTNENAKVAAMWHRLGGARLLIWLLTSASPDLVLPEEFAGRPLATTLSRWLGMLVPRGLPTRRERSRPGQGVPLVRGGRRLLRILSPAEVDALMAGLLTHRDRAMVAAMVLGGLRRCEVLGLRLGELHVAERRVFIAEGKGGRQRLVPVSGRFFTAVAAYLDAERPRGVGTDRVFVVLKGPRRGHPLTAKGMDVVLAAARRRAGLDHATCHELRHTCLTRLREAGMALEAVQAQAGHASIESTRIYLHLADDWLAAQYRKAAEVIDAQVFAGMPASGSWR